MKIKLTLELKGLSPESPENAVALMLGVIAARFHHGAREGSADEIFKGIITGGWACTVEAERGDIEEC